MPTPAQTVKERFESKDKLIEAVEKLMTDELWLPRLSSDRGGEEPAPKGLKHVSNKKLLHLHDVLTTVKEEFGSREALIGAILEVEGRSADDDYRSRLERFPAPRLYDQYQASKRRAARTAS